LINPQLATPTTATANRRAKHPEDLRQGEWSYDLKIDGIRALVEVRGYEVQIRNRTGRDITFQYPEVVEAFGQWGAWLVNNSGSGQHHVFDGEIVALSGSFEDTAIRDKQQTLDAIESQRKLRPVRFLAFDLLHQSLLVDDGDSPPTYLNTVYRVRRSILSQIFLRSDIAGPHISIVPSADSLDFIRMAKDLGFEGVIAKRLDSKYVGGRSSDWLKFKNLHRVTCIATGYEKGNGAREKFGAMHIAVIHDGALVSVGRVGTGFDHPQIEWLRENLDKGEVILVEIECLNRTKSNVLRFPVFKGVRTDVDITSATFDQIEGLPTS
jgi:bifunctional non-homologous end joining protein LigD